MRDDADRFVSPNENGDSIYMNEGIGAFAPIHAPMAVPLQVLESERATRLGAIGIAQPIPARR